MPQAKVIAGISIVAIAAVLASADSFQLSTQLQQDPWSVDAAVQRFQVAATHLPPSGSVGYLSDLAVNSAAFLTAQYALAPRLLIPAGHANPEQAIGNFSKPSDYAGIGAKAGYKVEADLGNGVVLYRKATR
jgi:hypothetical protein